MTRVYARARRDLRVHAAVPRGHWKIVTLLGARDHRGMLATITLEAATDREVFLASLDEDECSTRSCAKDHVVVMDNLSVHKVQGVRERIEARGATVLYLPPYSPGLNLSKKHGRNSTGTQSLGRKNRSSPSRASPSFSPPSPLRTQQHGAGCPSTHDSC